MDKKYIVELSALERAELFTLVRSGRAPARQVNRARILLKAEGGGEKCTDTEIAEALEIGVPTEQRAEFVWRMEDVLDVYHPPYEAKRPLLCMDEKPVQLSADLREPLPPRPGCPARRDYEYKREGTSNVFVAFEPLANWRKFQ